MKKKICIAVFAHDGIASHHCGVGTVVNTHLNILANQVKKIHPRSKLSLYAIAPFQNNKSRSYNPNIHAKIKRLCKLNGGSILFVENNSSGNVSWGNSSNWRRSSKEAALVAQKLMSTHDESFFFFHDDPFAATPYYLHRQTINMESAYCIWIPHSTSLLNDYPQPNEDRLDWELKAVRNIIACSGKVGYTSLYMQNHLLKEFRIPKRQLIQCRVGLDLYLKDDYSISDFGNNPFILSYGRCNPTKGFSNLIKAFLAIQKNIPHYLIILAPLDPYAAEYASEVQNLAKLAANRIKLFRQFKSNLPKKLISNPKCEMAVALSVREPCGLLPMEARLYSHNLGPTILASDDGGLGEQITPNLNGFSVNATSCENIANTILKIAKLSKKKKKKMVDNGRVILADRFDARKNLLKTLKELCKK